MSALLLALLIGCPSQPPLVDGGGPGTETDCPQGDCNTPTPTPQPTTPTPKPTTPTPTIGADFCNEPLPSPPQSCPFTTLTCGQVLDVNIGAIGEFYDRAFWTDIQIDFSETRLDEGEAVFFVDASGASTMRIEIESCNERYSRLIRGTACDASATARSGDYFSLDDNDVEYVEEIVQNNTNYEIVVESLGNPAGNTQIRVYCD